MKIYMGVPGKYRHAVTVLQAHPCMYKYRHRHSHGGSAAAKVPRSGTDGVQGQSPATLTFGESLVCYTCCYPGLLFGEKQGRGYGGTPSPQRVYEKTSP